LTLTLYSMQSYLLPVRSSSFPLNFHPHGPHSDDDSASEIIHMAHLMYAPLKLW